MKTNQEKNAMIAEFIGMQQTKVGWYDNEGVLKLPYTGDNTFDDLWFDRSWDWLMPVVEEIGLRNRVDITYMGIVTLYGLNRTAVQCYQNETFVKSIDISNNSGIEATYQVVVEFIEWYNQSKNAPQTEPAKEKVHQLTAQEFIEKYRVQLESELHKISRNYLLLKAEGSLTGSLYSPRWYNINDIFETIEDDMEAPLRVSFKSTQGQMYFSITVPRESMEKLQHLSMDLWEPFKRFRTKFLEENYPNIERY